MCVTVTNRCELRLQTVTAGNGRELTKLKFRSMFVGQERNCSILMMNRYRNPANAANHARSHATLSPNNTAVCETINDCIKNNENISFQKFLDS